METPRTDEVLNALLNRFVDSSLEKLRHEHYPALGAEVISKQLEAAAWLYYYHLQRSYAGLDYYDPDEFCKKAVILRAGLDPYLNNVGPRVKAACAAADMRSSQSKVARVGALVLSSDRNKCLLLESLVTDRLWSLVEAEKKDGESALEAALEAVNKYTGLERTSVRVDESFHEARSMSQEGNWTRLYVMVCKTDAEVNLSMKFSWMSLDELVLKATGNFLSKSWEWEPTATMDYLHIYPYVSVLQSLLSSVELPKAATKIIEDLNGSNVKQAMTLSKSKRDRESEVIVIDSEDEEEVPRMKRERKSNKGDSQPGRNTGNKSSPVSKEQVKNILPVMAQKAIQKQASAPSNALARSSVPALRGESDSRLQVTETHSIDANHTSSFIQDQLEKFKSESALLADSFQSQAIVLAENYHSQAIALAESYHSQSTALYKKLFETLARQTDTFEDTSFLVHLRDPIQELEEFCVRNRWLQPTYDTQSPLDDQTRHHHTVTVQLCGTGVELSETGASSSSFLEAKQSAASLMLGKLYLLRTLN